MSEPAGKHRALTILEDLIAIESVNPHYGEGTRGERDVADYIERRARRAGLRVTRQPVLPGRDNILVELRTGRAVPTLLFESHMDTVSLGLMKDPLVPTYRGGRLYGRGACDTKATLAGMLYAMEECAGQTDPLPCDLVFCAAVDEEHAYRGVTALIASGFRADGAVVGEPTGLKIVPASKGCARFAVRTLGRAAHSSVPQEGDNAIYRMMDMLRYLRETAEPALAKIRHPLCGSPTLSVGVIRGGQQINIVPDRCEIEVDRRIVPGESPERVIAEMEDGMRKALEPEGVVLQVETLLLDWALDTPIDAPIVQAARRTADRLGLSSALAAVPFGSDASKLQALAGIPSIVYGPGSIEQAHSSEEWVPVREVEQAAELYTALARAFDGTGGG
jgi:acetylornithine deacetylase